MHDPDGATGQDHGGSNTRADRLVGHIRLKR